jgi:hypothetical protein
MKKRLAATFFASTSTLIMEAIRRFEYGQTSAILHGGTSVTIVFFKPFNNSVFLIQQI